MASSGVDWHPVTLFHVEYEKGDKLGMLLAWLSLTPMLFFFFLMGYGAARRDLHSFSLMIGICLSVILNNVLKRTIKEPRPTGHEYPKTYGMPSDHSQFTSFVAAYCIFMFYSSWLPNRRSLKGSTWYLHPIPFVAMAIVAAMMYSRVHLLYHTTAQVYYGCAIGFVFGLLWAVFVKKCLEPYFPAVASWPFCRWFLIRDYSLIPNSSVWEYSVACQEAERRRQKRKE